MSKIKYVLLWLWQLPQNILGFLLSRSNCKRLVVMGIPVYYKDKFFRSGISLGNYIILDKVKYNSDITVMHEHGHQYQSLYFGWFYLIVIGLPSVVRNIWQRLTQRNWTVQERIRWYYSGYPEKWADKLGGVTRRW